MIRKPKPYFLGSFKGDSPLWAMFWRERETSGFDRFQDWYAEYQEYRENFIAGGG
jgi:hypothetical protein